MNCVVVSLVGLVPEAFESLIGEENCSDVTDFRMVLDGRAGQLASDMWGIHH